MKTVLQFNDQAQHLAWTSKVETKGEFSYNSKSNFRKEGKIKKRTYNAISRMSKLRRKTAR